MIKKKGEDEAKGFYLKVMKSRRNSEERSLRVSKNVPRQRKGK